MSKHFADDWYFGYAPMPVLEFDDNGEKIKLIDSRNVVGRFRDSRTDPRNGEVIDGPASRAARKAVYKCVPILETKSLKTANGAGSDVTATQIRFDEDFAEASMAAVARFKEAWDAYQAVRKSSVTAEEAGVLGTVAPAPKAARPRKQKPHQAENVVPLKAETA